MSRALILPAVLGITMSAIFFLPPFELVDSAMDIELPPALAGADLRTRPPSEAELAILANDTDFSKATCMLPRVEERSFITGTSPIDHLELSIVLSGTDLANSIHRPERCMVAQGHDIHTRGADVIELAEGRELPVMRLVSTYRFETGPPDARVESSVEYLTYYFFIGKSRITESHLERTLIDIKDRLLEGEAQRWAYVSLGTMFVDGETREFGGPLTYDLADKKIRGILAELAERKVDWGLIGR